MCLYVTYTGLFTADGVGFWLLDLPPCPESLPKPLSILGICQLLPDQEWIVQHHKCLLPKPGSDGYQSPISGARGRLENVGFHYCSKFALIRAFKYRNTNYLSPSQLPKNMLYLLYRFAGSQVPRQLLLTGPSLPEDQNNPIYRKYLEPPKCHADIARGQGVW